MKTEVALKVVAEWLEEREMPAMVTRRTPPVDLARCTQILAITGPRRAGKTFLMYQLIKGLLESGARKEDILFVDFEDYRLLDFTGTDAEQLFVAFNRLTGRYPQYVFLDEVQHLPHWSRVVRTLHNQGTYRIVLSGSSSELQGQEIATELRGRCRDLRLLPFSFPEYLECKRVSYTDASLRTATRGRLLKAFDEYLNEGGFPEVVQQGTSLEKRQLLQSYYQTIFYRDILDRHNVRSRYLLELMMRYCLDTYGDLFSISGFEKRLKAHELTGSKRTVSNYLQYLQQAFFVILSEKFSYSPRKRLMNPKKVYLLDTGFKFLSTEFSPNLGKVLENLVAIELFRRQEDCSYYRGKREVDFLVCRAGKPDTAIQVCWKLDQADFARELGGLVEVAQQFAPKDLLVLTYEQEGLEEFQGCKFRVAPVWKWLLGE